MKTFTNKFGGTTTTLVAGDDIGSLPAELYSILAPELIDVFGDPMDWISGIAKRTSFESFERLLDQFIDCNTWEFLVVDPNFPMPTIISGLRFFDMKGASCCLHPQVGGNYDGLLPEIFEDIQWMNWGGLGFAGQLKAEDQWPCFSELGFTCKHPSLGSNTTRIFADSPDGDVMVCNEDGSAGYVSHEDGSAYEFGQLSEMIDWIFRCLSNGTWPEFDWNRIQKM